MNIAAIRSYIQNEILNDANAEIGDDQDLLLSETLDSLSVVRLVDHLQREMQIEIPPEDVTLEHFGSLVKMETYLATRRA